MECLCGVVSIASLPSGGGQLEVFTVIGLASMACIVYMKLEMY